MELEVRAIKNCLSVKKNPFIYIHIHILFYVYIYIVARRHGLKMNTFNTRASAERGEGDCSEDASRSKLMDFSRVYIGILF